MGRLDQIAQLGTGERSVAEVVVGGTSVRHRIEVVLVSTRTSSIGLSSERVVGTPIASSEIGFMCDTVTYPKGIKVSDEELASVPLKPHDFHVGEVGGWLGVG